MTRALRHANVFGVEDVAGSRAGFEVELQRMSLGGRCGFGVGSTNSLFCPASQTQLPQQKLQLQEACMRKEKSVAVLEHQLMEVEVRG